MAEVMTPEEVVTELEKMEDIFVGLFIERVKLKTPVLSGALRDGWEGTIDGTNFMFTNTQDYAAHIEYGTEHIAPVGMVTSTFPETEQLFEQARKRTRLR